MGELKDELQPSKKYKIENEKTREEFIYTPKSFENINLFF